MRLFAILYLYCFLGVSFAKEDGPSSTSKKDDDSMTASAPRNDEQAIDQVDDSVFDPIQGDYNCGDDDPDPCEVEWAPPISTVEQDEEGPSSTADTCDDPESSSTECAAQDSQDTKEIDKHWGSDKNVLNLRKQLLAAGSGGSTDGPHRRPPIFLMPGLASTRLVAWRFKACPALLSDIKVQDYVWLNINLVIQMSAFDAACLTECLKLGRNQTDFDDPATGCKLRPDEGLDAISSLSPGGFTPNLFVGGTNTVYAWLIQWLSDHLGYDVTNIIGLPYDWRLSPDKMESRDGFLTLTRRKMEAAVKSNGAPGIMVAHSMGNTIFRYFLDWLRVELREEVYERYARTAERRQKSDTEATTVKNSRHGWVDPTNKKAVPKNVVNSTIDGSRNEQLWELAMIEGDANWHEWIEQHIWTYVGLSAPLLGAVNPLRATISGENMGLPFTDEVAREMEKTFGSTLTISPLSSKSLFCDEWDVIESWDEESTASKQRHADSKLACIDDVVNDIEFSNEGKPYHMDPWARFPTLKQLLLQRMDWDSDIPMIRILQETCQEKEKPPCSQNKTMDVSPREIERGELYLTLSKLWKEEGDPMRVKQEQLQTSFWDTKVPNLLNRTWERPLIKHVIMAYGTDIATEVGYEFAKVERNSSNNSEKEQYDSMPEIRNVFWETAAGHLQVENMQPPPNNPISGFWKKKRERKPFRKGSMDASGDGSVPYVSLSFAQTWLLHSIRARIFSNNQKEGPANPLDEIEISHRPEDGNEWKTGRPPRRLTIPDEKRFEESADTGTTHPHGTKYKPAMVRYRTSGTSRTTGIEYTTSVIEAAMVEHKETTRCVVQLKHLCSIF